MIDAYFADAATDRLHVAEIAESQPIEPDTDPLGDHAAIRSMFSNSPVLVTVIILCPIEHSFNHL